MKTNPGLAKIREALITAHKNRHGTTDDLVIGFQLTHSGRFCKPNDKFRMEPRVAYRHPILDIKFKVESDAQVWTDSEIEQLIQDYIKAAKVAWDVGADFVDIKHCHGYLLHEFLSAFTRPRKYGGSFENRTRILRESFAVSARAATKSKSPFALAHSISFPSNPIRRCLNPASLGQAFPRIFHIVYRTAMASE